jgi:hypothetical protein
MEENTIKKLIITGSQNRHQIKNLISDYKKEKEMKKRIPSENWSFSQENYKYEKQFNLIMDISNNNFHYFNEISKITINEINKKISSYKQQDKIKSHYDKSKFLTFEAVINKMMECKLKCRYCKNEMNVLYDISRELSQWSVDRIDNDLGHNCDNFHLACLDCNLKRRRRTDEKYLFTKQLNIVKQDNNFKEKEEEEPNNTINKTIVMEVKNEKI